MFKIQQSGLILLSELGVNFDIECSPVHHKNQQWWQLEVLTNKEGIKDRGILCTAKNEPRYFKQLNSITEFLEENSIEITKFTVSLKIKE